MRNRELFDTLFASKHIDLSWSPLLDSSPSPAAEGFDFNRVDGMMLGLAIGDSLGNTTEGQLPTERRAHFGEIRDYLPNRHAGGRAVGVPSDDTQLAYWTLEQMLMDGGLNPDHVAGSFCSKQIFGIGNTVREFIAQYKSGKVPWFECGVKSAGNGALMRIAPIVTPHLRSATSDLWSDTALLAMLTHNDAGSISACLAFVRILWDLLQMKNPRSRIGGWRPTCKAPENWRGILLIARAAVPRVATVDRSGGLLQNRYLPLTRQGSPFWKPVTGGTRERTCWKPCPVCSTS